MSALAIVFVFVVSLAATYAFYAMRAREQRRRWLAVKPIAVRTPTPYEAAMIEESRRIEREGVPVGVPCWKPLALQLLFRRFSERDRNN